MSDVATRWNSTLYMLERYLKLEPTVLATLLTPELKKDVKSIAQLDELSETAGLEDVITILKELEESTVLVSSASTATISLILPTQSSILTMTEPNETDCTLLKEF